MDILEILDALPHRYPMLLVDRVIELVPGSRLKAVKNITMNEAFFQGHFPGRPIMPGVMVIEALAQTCSLLAAHDEACRRIIKDDGLMLFTGIDKAKFRRPVVPGDVLFLLAEVRRLKSTNGIYGSFDVQARVEDKDVVTAQLSLVVRPDPAKN